MLYQRKLLDGLVQSRETPLHVASREGNENIFWFLYSSLSAKTCEDFGSIEDYLLIIPKENDSSRSYTAFPQYFQNCDDNFDILKAIQKNFGIPFIKRLFRIKMNLEENLLHKISESDRNILKVLTFLRENFSDDLWFLWKIFCWSRDMAGKSFLHVAFQTLENETLM
jgi:hypothetical protein